MSGTPSVVPPTRAFLAVAALGAGLLHAALAPSAPLPLLILLVIVAAAELAWSVTTLARDLPLVFRLVPVLALIPVGLWASLAVVGATATSGTVLALPLIPMGVASLLDVAVAAVSAVVLRRGRPASQRGGALRFVAALALSASAVCAVTIPALGLTDAGIAAVTVGHHH
ncbi:hypothetical protein LLS1_02190 [Leifsonia sp. LS1]|uniref:hypothetical protein n=1 Tax=Leifsonia sp. LS1 TaxID=2828483 RepID=UPI001CFE6B52|nr:hypothetical protein [Leifsonia sp. LS1]GIT78550.1 hypothetical protein LLS1_02190 [Leifsonia sp. LS1]